MMTGVDARKEIMVDKKKGDGVGGCREIDRTRMIKRGG
jgi:hypothetical protein